VETLGERCFEKCHKLATVTFLPDSRLARIEVSAFEQCSALSAFVVPSSVIFIGEAAFSSCGSLSAFQFAAPARVRELLSLPSRLGSWTDIPDSVEVLSFLDNLGKTCRHVLAFGCESKLRWILIHCRWGKPRPRFVRVASRTLKVFRSDREFPQKDCRAPVRFVISRVHQ
jgi:hypothetical protein